MSGSSRRVAACLAKRVYLSEMLARNAVVLLGLAGRLGLEPYECVVCGDWHLTSGGKERLLEQPATVEVMEPVSYPVESWRGVPASRRRTRQARVRRAREVDRVERRLG